MSLNKYSLLKRIGSTVIALPVYVLCFYTDSFYSIPLLLLSIIVSSTCLYEYYQIARQGDNREPVINAGILTGIIINLLVYIFAFGRVYGFNKYIEPFDVRYIFAVIVIFIIIISIIHIFKRPIDQGIYSLAVTVFGIIFIVIPFSHIILLKALKNGFYYILIFHIVIFCNDTFAYFFGSIMGKHSLNLSISPNKTWEGYFSGLLFSILSIIITCNVYEIFFSVDLFNTVEAAILGIFMSILGHLGDLIESAIKRDSSIKDSGSIIPGHGGMWDVFDAAIFVMPLFYYYLLIKGVQ